MKRGSNGRNLLEKKLIVLQHFSGVLLNITRAPLPEGI